MLATVTCGDESLPAIYKPERGERPLWDYDAGLWRREVATYEASEALGWNLVPETVARLDAPMGQGSVQRFIADADFEQHYFTRSNTHICRSRSCVVASSISVK